MTAATALSRREAAPGPARPTATLVPIVGHGTPTVPHDLGHHGAASPSGLAVVAGLTPLPAAVPLLAAVPCAKPAAGPGLHAGGNKMSGVAARCGRSRRHPIGLVARHWTGRADVGRQAFVA